MPSSTTKNLEVSFFQLTTDGKRIFKVTRRIPILSVAETLFFTSKDEAKKQFLEWLQ